MSDQSTGQRPSFPLGNMGHCNGLGHYFNGNYAITQALVNANVQLILSNPSGVGLADKNYPPFGPQRTTQFGGWLVNQSDNYITVNAEGAYLIRGSIFAKISDNSFFGDNWKVQLDIFIADDAGGPFIFQATESKFTLASWQMTLCPLTVVELVVLPKGYRIQFKLTLNAAVLPVGERMIPSGQNSAMDFMSVVYLGPTV